MNIINLSVFVATELELTEQQAIIKIINALQTGSEEIVVSPLLNSTQNDAVSDTTDDHQGTEPTPQKNPLGEQQSDAVEVKIKEKLESLKEDHEDDLLQGGIGYSNQIELLEEILQLFKIKSND